MSVQECQTCLHLLLFANLFRKDLWHLCYTKIQSSFSSCVSSHSLPPPASPSSHHQYHHAFWKSFKVFKVLSYTYSILYVRSGQHFIAFGQRPFWNFKRKKETQHDLWKKKGGLKQEKNIKVRKDLWVYIYMADWPNTPHVFLNSWSLDKKQLEDINYFK